MARLAALALVLVTLGSTTARADVISVNFSSGSTYDLASGTAAGVVSATNWNNFTSPATNLNNLKDKFGATTSAGASISYTGGTGGYVTYATASISGASPGTTTLYRSGIRPTATGSVLSVSVSNIPYAVYDVYVYASQNTGSTNTLSVSDGTTTYYYKTNGAGMTGAFGLTRVTSTDPLNPTVGNANYEVFSGKTGSSFTFTVEGSVTGTISNNLYGFQIVNAVPEPGTLLLGGIAAACGGTGVWFKRRKKALADQPAEPTA